MPDISAIVILSLLALGGVTQAPNTVTRATTTVATVDRIDRSRRVLTTRSADNVIRPLSVDPSIKAFDDLNVGDVITVRFTESVVVEVRPNAKMTKLEDTTAAAQEAGDATVVQQQKRVVTIEDIDSQGLFVSYRTSDNTRAVRPVQNKELLKGLKRGDRIEITLTLARAISIERKR